MLQISLDQPNLTDGQRQALHEMWLRCVRRILVSTTIAGSGHPGGSLSSLHLVLLLYSTMRHRADDPCWADRDRLLPSMGHISPCIYSVLAEFGYIPEDRLLLEFRHAGSSFTGHVECCVPGVEWNTGNLGQGLSAGAGMALALKLKKSPARVAVLMGDGEQQKGQIGEARRFAVKYELNNLCGIVDRNHLQIGGATNQVMPQMVRAEYVAAQWNTLYLEDGHDVDAIFDALRRIHLGNVEDPRFPSVIVARTVMGKGVSFMEHKAKYHGSVLSESEAAAALDELGLDNPIPELKRGRKTLVALHDPHCAPVATPAIDPGQPRDYPPDKLTDNRSAYGNALEDLARLNNLGAIPRVLGVSCDLEGSVKMEAFHHVNPGAFYECGIQEHHAATLAGAASKEGFVCFFSTFGVFAVCETYNQHRLNDINDTQIKIVSTHLGLDVGEDGQTHQCIDYIGLMQNLFGFSIFMPADPNQTDRIVRHVAATPGNCFVGMGRSKTPLITDEEGRPLYGGSYRFVPGKADWVCAGDQGAILAYGATLHHAVGAARELRAEHGLRLAVLNMASIKPLDVEAVRKVAETGLIVTVEDHHPDTGLGARVALAVADAGVACRVIRLGVKAYGLSGKPGDLYRLEGIDQHGIMASVLEARANGWLKP